MFKLSRSLLLLLAIAGFSGPQVVLASHPVGQNAQFYSGVDVAFGSGELEQWKPAPDDAGECTGDKCAAGGSY